MKCYRCKKPINRAAAVIPTKADPANYGPKCAILAGLIKPQPRAKQQAQLQLTPTKPRAPRIPKAKVCAGQADWINDLEQCDE